MQSSEPSSGVIVSDVCRSPMAYGAQKTFWWVHALPRKRSMITALDAAAKLKEEWTLHDIRRTVRTGLGKLGVAPHIAEAVLNHLPAKLIRPTTATLMRTRNELRSMRGRAIFVSRSRRRRGRT
jgi:hypothetical protein